MPLEYAARNKFEFDSDFGDPIEVVKEIVEAREADLAYDKRNRQRGLEDAKFTANFQWPEADWKWRQAQKIPTFQFNRVPKLIRQRLANRAKTRVGPRVTPTAVLNDHGPVANLREGLMRAIDRQSDISVVDMLVSQGQMVSGISNYLVNVEESFGDVFLNDIVVRAEMNPFAVVWDEMSWHEPTGREATHVLVEYELPRRVFERAYPKASTDGLAVDQSFWQGLVSSIGTSSSKWCTKDTVRIGTFWRVIEKKRLFAQMENGDVLDITGKSPEDARIERGDGTYFSIAKHPDTGQPMVREGQAKFAECIVTNGSDILMKPKQFPINRVPVVRVPGWLVHVDDYIHRFGAVSFVKDPITFNNYVRSDRAERIVYRPRANWRSSMEETQGLETEWENSHKLRGGILRHHGAPGAGPQPIEPPRVDQAAILESQQALEDINDMMDAGPNLAGDPANSNVALETQMDASNSGDLLYRENYLAAKREVYDLMNQLIPYVYDTPRVVTIIGQDNDMKEAIVNDKENPESQDITLGKYKVAIETGPAETTQRTHFLRMLETMVNASPESMSVAIPEIIKLYNFPGGDKLAETVAQRLGLADESPEAQEAAQKQQQIEELRVQLEFTDKQLDIAKKEAEIERINADTESKIATTDSELAQAEERRAAAAQRVIEGRAKVEELQARVDLIFAQINKVLTEPAQGRTTGD